MKQFPIFPGALYTSELCIARHPLCLSYSDDRSRSSSCSKKGAPIALTWKFRGFDYVSYYNDAYENDDSLPALVATGANVIEETTIDWGIDPLNNTVTPTATIPTRSPPRRQ